MQHWLYEQHQTSEGRETLNFYLVYKKALGEYHASLKIRFVVKKPKTFFNDTEAKV